MRRRLLSMLAATGLGVALTVAIAPSSDAADYSCATIDFDTATVTPVAASDSTRPSTRNRLTVTGTKAATNVYVGLVPVKYIAQPVYWGIVVTGCSSGIGMPVLTPYRASYEFDWTMGTCGIEVIGASRSQQFDLAGCAPVPLTGTRWVLDPASLGVAVPAGTSITANFSATTISGSSGCNTYRATYTVGADGAFSLGPVAMTARACDPATNAAEWAFLGRLGRAKQVRATTSQLQLRAEGQTLLRFTPAPAVTPASA
jgi:heat shock protein HslJ